MTAPLRVVSYGGGVQSTALLVLAARREIDFPVFLMANVGDDSEYPATLTYVREIAMPFAEEHGIELHLLDRHKKDGSTETLWGRMMRAESRALPIPMRGDNGAPMKRSCTVDFKVKVTGRWLKAHGATGGRRCLAHMREDGPLANAGIRADCEKCVQPNVATVGIGISVDEIHRANASRVEPHERIVYPLLDLNMRRGDCERLIADAGLPVPPKSSCFFCPFHRVETWRDLATDHPELFDRACTLEDTINARRETNGLDGKVWLTRYGIPLRDVTSDAQQRIPFDDDGSGSCDSGWCMT